MSDLHFTRGAEAIAMVAANMVWHLQNDQLIVRLRQHGNPRSQIASARHYMNRALDAAAALAVESDDFTATDILLAAILIERGNQANFDDLFEPQRPPMGAFVILDDDETPNDGDTDYDQKTDADDRDPPVALAGAQAPGRLRLAGGDRDDDGSRCL